MNRVLGCQPKGFAKCVASGDPHYISFDGLRYDFQGTCTYTFTKVVVNDPELVNFSVVVENESYGNGGVAVTRLVVVSVYGYTVAIQRDMSSKVKVRVSSTNIFSSFPFPLMDFFFWIETQGTSIIKHL